jgi:hypothetical protein
MNSSTSILPRRRTLPYLVPKEADKVYELVARLDEVLASTVSGNVSFETSVAAQPMIEVPVIVNVFKP